MGNKRERKGKHVFLYGAYLLIILLLIAGCGTTLNLQKRRQGNKHLNLAENLLNKGDYDAALEEYEAAASLFSGDSPGDNALLRMGLIWAHPDNPQRDYKKALECFQRLVRDFPDSSLREEAGVWSGAVNELILRGSKINELEETLNGLKIELADLKESGIRIEGKNKELEDTVKTLKRRINALKEAGIVTEERNKDLEATVYALKKQLNALKEIDLGIEEKKREDLTGEKDR